MKDAGQEGFVLAATLWFVALLALVAVVVEGWLSPVLDRANSLNLRVRSESAQISAVDRVAYLTTTGGFSARGLELAPKAEPAEARRLASANQAPPLETPFIALDGRPYRLDSAVVRLQDEGGLYDLSNISRESLQKLLRSYDLATSDIATMTAGLVDYQSKTPDVRSDAIRDSDYLRAGLPLARHARLLTPWEPYRILGWPHTEALWRGSSSLAEMVTTGPIGGLNLNTAPAQVLIAIAGIGERQAAQLVAARVDRPIANARDITSPGEGSARRLEFIPSSIIRLKLEVVDDPLLHIVSLRLTPTGAAPYRVDYAFDLPQGAGGDARTDATAPVLPTGSAIR